MGLTQEPIYKSSFAMVNVRNDGDITKVGSFN
jgi:hypothetical protein